MKLWIADKNVGIPKPNDSSPFKRTFNPTSFEDCPRKYYLTKIAGVQQIQRAVYFEYGTAIHEAVSTFYYLREKSPEEILATNPEFFDTAQSNEMQQDGSLSDSHHLAKAAAIAAFVEVWNKADHAGDNKRSLPGGIQTISAYCDTYKDDTAVYDLDYIETPQWITMPNGTQLGGVIDRVKREGKYIAVIDTKTSSMALTQWFFKQFDTSFQMSCYYYFISQIFGYCTNIEIDGIKVPFNEKATEKSPNFARYNTDRTELQISEFLNSYDKMTNEICHNLDQPRELWPELFYQKTSRCGDYGGCMYKDICRYGLEHPAIKTEFEIIPVKEN